MKKRLRHFLQNIERFPKDILIASHPYGSLCVPYSNRFSLQQAIMEIRRSTPLTIVCDPPINDEGFADPTHVIPDIIIFWGVSRKKTYVSPCPSTMVIRQLCISDFLKTPRVHLFSGHLTSPWTLFKVPNHMRALNASPARKSLMEMLRTTHALRRADPQLIRQRLRSIETTVKIWLYNPVPKHPSGFRLALFPQEEGVDRTQALLGPDSVHIMTKPDEADLITRLIIAKCRNGRNEGKITVTDATANVGGNTLSFSRSFERVNAIEIDPTNFQALCANIQLFKRTNVKCIMGDFVDLLHSMCQDVVFIDPPWGGSGYRMHRHINLTLSGRPLSEVVSKLVKKAEAVVVKVPLNFDTAVFFRSDPLSTLLENGTMRFEIMSMKSFMILFIFYMNHYQ